jgi:hypothetical protein
MKDVYVYLVMLFITIKNIGRLHLERPAINYAFNV